MILALDRTLGLAASLFPPALVSPEALRSLVAIAGELPQVASCGAVECRLGKCSRVDLLMCMIAREGGHQALLRCRSGEASAPAVLSTPAWRGVLDFCAAWADPASILHAWVPVFWLEFDVEGDGAAPAPLPFPCVDEHLLDDRPPGEQDEAKRSASLQVIRRALSLLLDRPLACPAEAAMTSCIERLPPRGRALHVAPLATRGLDGVRVVSVLPKGDLPGYLDSIEWPGSMLSLEALLTAMAAHMSYVTCHLDVTASVQPALGVEISFPPGDPRWEPLLDELYARGACEPDKRAALMRWPAEAQVTLPRHRWPSRILGNLMIKLVMGPQRPLEAEAYLGFTHRISLLG